ncbi:MAG: RnfABCDGE type electron transport complex subunit D [Lachnospiraceae bacterium]|nr:RnfABCDGE type electron transport complex subunit D [Lachnospiraceae bacterium]
MDNQNVIVSATPHVCSKDSTRSIMLDVIIALVPACVMGIYYFGFNALLLMLVSVASAMLSEAAFQKIMKRPSTTGDLSAAVTGLLLALNMPASAPLWTPVVGSVFAIIIVKQIFGGIGQNFVNPALAGRAFLLASYPTIMTAWTLDGVSTATPLALLKSGSFVPAGADIASAFFGHIGGCIGETSAIALLIGGIYLIVKQVISWRIPVIYIATVMLLTWIIGRNGVMTGFPVYEAVVGGLMLGAIFMATDYATSPVTAAGQVIFALGCGLLTALIRTKGGYPEGVSYSILIMNLCVPLIDKFTRPRVFGTTKAKEAKKA